MSEERRLVTVLFVDVVGSTTLGETLDPEDVRALLGRLFAIARDSVDARGGRVEKFIGDAIMAVFGLPIAHGDDPARALAAALELRDRVREDPSLKDRIAIRLGINGGEVIATRDADASQFLVTGDAVNTAARLQAAAEPWAILVGDRTVRATRDAFTFGPMVQIEAKGKTATVAARELRGAADQAASRSTQRLVGRDSDLLQLDLVARRSIDEGRPYLVNIVAPAGVGKSRLLEEFLGRLDGNVRVALAQCLPYGQRLTFWPMRAILLSIVGLPDSAPPDEVRDALLAWHREHGDVEAERTADLLAATIGASETETGDRLALFGAWRRFIELAAEERPLVLVIEDLHWSSDSLLDLVEAILQAHADVPLLMIALARPELLDRRPSWGGGRRNSLSIALEPLPDRAVIELVRDLLPDASPELAEAIVVRAEGNPFYAGEIVRTLRDRLGPDPSPAQVAGAIAALPDTIYATVLARLDALEPTARRTVQLGAVIGRSFPVGAIPALEPALEQGAIDEAIRLLVDRDMLRPAGHGAVSFRHILIREVAYGTLPRTERARLHQAAGRWLDADAIASGREDELAELVAFHYREAAALAVVIGEPPSPEEAERAVRWLRRAAEVTFAGGANVEAARHLDAAIELATPPMQADIHERLGQVWGGGDQGVTAFDTAYDLGKQLGLGRDQELRTLAQSMIIRSRWAGSIASRISAEETAARFAEIERLLPLATTDRARVLGWLGISFSANIRNTPDPRELEISATAAASALEVARSIDDPDLISAALDAMDTIAFADNRFADIRPLNDQRLALGDRLSTSERLDAWIVIAWADVMLGNLDAAERSARTATAGLTIGQAPGWVAGATAWRVLALYLMGRWDEALSEAHRMRRAVVESELKAPWFMLNGVLAAFLIDRAKGDPVSADAWRAIATATFEGSDPGIRTQRLASFFRDDLERLASEVIGDWLRFTGRLDYPALVLIELGDRRVAADRDALDAMIPYAEERSIRFLSGPARRLRGLMTGDPAELRNALSVFETIGARPFAIRVRGELAVLEGDREAAEAAVSALEDLGDLRQAARLAADLRAGSIAVTGPAGARASGAS
ncbi:MAG TPA: adenylate/guanylate cyclase domain-containing protein [Candidatus Limnocylindrales bacterium]|nr:adenylate/guanylate cyclase domain-containing protein [Candidatus Limnocylindrales bacterium]